MLSAIEFFLILLLPGMPVALAIAVPGFSFFLMRPEIPWTILIQRSLPTTQSFTIFVAPLFILAGNLMNNTSIASRLVKLANVLTDHMYGSTGQVSVTLLTLMGDVSGSTIAGAAMERHILRPEVIKRGYALGWVAAINCPSGLIATMIPPSMDLVLYGTVGGVPIGRLFVVGFLPGIIMCIFMMLATSWFTHHYGYQPDHNKPSPLGTTIKSCFEGIWTPILSILLIVLTRFGVMTPSESGTSVIFCALFVGIFIYKELNPRKFKRRTVGSVKNLSVITMILASSGIFSYGVVFDQLPETLTIMLVGLIGNEYMLLLPILIMLTVFGVLMETTVITLTATPVLIPITIQYGIDPVYFGIIMMIIVTMGCSTLPVGVALYTCFNIMDCSAQEATKHSLPLFITIPATLAIYIFFPGLMLFLSSMIYGTGM